MKRIVQAAIIPIAVALAMTLPACGDDAPPTDPGDDSGTNVTTETCIDCHSSEAALKATVASVSAPEATIVAAGDG